MKYVAVFEIPEDKVGLLELTLPISDELTVTTPIEYKKAPEPMNNDMVGIDGFYGGYNQALRDCGVLEE